MCGRMAKNAKDTKSNGFLRLLRRAAAKVVKHIGNREARCTNVRRWALEAGSWRTIVSGDLGGDGNVFPIIRGNGIQHADPGCRIEI